MADAHGECAAERVAYEACFGDGFSAWVRALNDAFSGKTPRCQHEWETYQDCVTVAQHRRAAARVLGKDE